MSRFIPRHVFAALLALLVVPILPALPAFAAEGDSAKTAVEVWKDPNCGCCVDWVSHMEQNGFAVTVHETGNAAKRAELGMPENLGSCHTALVEGYVIEGHIPAEDIRKLLEEKPDAIGLAVPGMPLGSPGMDGPVYEGRKDPYNVLLVSKDAQSGEVSTQVFTRHR